MNKEAAVCIWEAKVNDTIQYVTHLPDVSIQDPEQIETSSTDVTAVTISDRIFLCHFGTLKKKEFNLNMRPESTLYRRFYRRQQVEPAHMGLETGHQSISGQTHTHTHTHQLRTSRLHSQRFQALESNPELCCVVTLLQKKNIFIARNTKPWSHSLTRNITWISTINVLFTHTHSHTL